MLATLVLLLAVPSLAALPSTPDSAAPADSVTQEIDAKPDAEADEQIAERLRGIYGELERFQGVTVAVDQGVVTLSGTVPDSTDIDQAESIASRVTGVVTIDNGLERDISIAEGAGALGSITENVERFLEMLPLIGLALAIVLVVSAIGYAIAGQRGFWERVAPNVFLAELIASAIRFVFVVGAIVIALDMLGAGALMGAVLGGAGVVGIALGFAMRDTIENYVASLMLSLRQPFRANDHVLIDDKEGRVIRLTSRATVLMTVDGNHLRIPNGQVFRAVILNYTRNPQRRFDFELGVDADDDAEAARSLGRDTLAGLDFILEQPAPEVRITQVGDSNVVLRFLGWIDQGEADWHKAKSRAIAACKVALEEAGFALPEPIYRLRFDQRTATLPFQNIGEGQSAAPVPAPAPTPTPTPAPSGSVDEDVSPDDDIARMVDAERATPDEGQEEDLLDSGRPVE